MGDKPKKKSGAKRPSRAKPAVELTDEEVMRRLFPKKVRETIKREAEESDRKAEKKGSQRHDDPS